MNVNHPCSNAHYSANLLRAAWKRFATCTATSSAILRSQLRSTPSGAPAPPSRWREGWSRRGTLARCRSWRTACRMQAATTRTSSNTAGDRGHTTWDAGLWTWCWPRSRISEQLASDGGRDIGAGKNGGERVPTFHRDLLCDFRCVEAGGEPGPSARQTRTPA